MKARYARLLPLLPPADPEHWWASETVLLLTVVPGSGMAHLVWYNRDDDANENDEADLQERLESAGIFELPDGVNAIVTHDEKAWVASRLVGVETHSLLRLANALTDLHARARELEG